MICSKWTGSCKMTGMVMIIILKNWERDKCAKRQKLSHKMCRFHSQLQPNVVAIQKVFSLNRWRLNWSSELNSSLPLFHFWLFQLLYSHPFSLSVPPPLSDDVAGNAKRNFKLSRRRRMQRGAGREKCWGRQNERRVFPSPSFPSLGTGQVPTSMYFTVWLGGHRECWPVMHGVMSLCPCPLFFTLPG